MKTARAAAPIALLALTAAGLFVVEAGPPPAPLTLAEEGSSFRIYVSKKGLAKRFAHDHVIGLSKFKGRLDLKPGDWAKSAVSFSLKAADLQVLDSELSKDDKAEVKSNMDKEVLEVDEHPTIRFKSSRVRFQKKRQDKKRGEVSVVRVTGALQLHGESKSLSLDVELHQEKGRWVATGETELTQSRWGIEPYSAFLGAVGVKDKVKVRFRLLAAP